MSNTVAAVGFLQNVPAGSTVYFAPFNTVGGINFTTESNVQTPLQTGFTAYNFAAFLFTNSMPFGGAGTITMRKNGVDTALTITVPSGTPTSVGHFVSNTAVVEYKAGDTCDIKVSVTGASGAIGGGYTFICKQASIVTRLNSCGRSIFSNIPSQTNYVCASGEQYGELADETLVQNYIGTAGGTWSKAQINVTTNSFLSAVVVRSRINGVNGNQAISCTAHTTGVFSDLSNTDTVGVDDKINWTITTPAATGAIQESMISSQIAYAGSSYDTFWMAGQAGDALPASNSSNPFLRWPLQRGIGGQEDFGTSRAAITYTPFVLSALRVHVTANTLANACPVVAMREGIPQTVGLSIPPSVTGWISDLSGNTALYGAFDRWSFRFDNRKTTVGSGSFTTQAMTCVMTDIAVSSSIDNVTSIRNVTTAQM